MGKSYGRHGATVEADDSAFMLFAFVVVLIIVIPWAFILLKRILWSILGWVKTPIRFACKCSNCMEIKVKGKAKLKTSWMTTGYFVQVIIVLGLIYLLFSMGKYLDELKKRQGFDPYEILGVSTLSTESEIKVAYRKLAVVMHPDKSPDDPNAADKFMELHQAYRALTDPVGKANYMKYGNPDGPTSFSVGIPLPSFLFKDEYKNYTLIVFFTFLLIIIPGGGYWLYSILFKYNKYGILASNEYKFGKLVNEKLKAKNIPELLSNADEFSKGLTSTSVGELEKLPNKLKLPEITPISYKVQLLMHSFISKFEIKDPKLLEDQKYVLLLTLRLLSYLADLTSQIGYSIPIIPEVLKFSQNFYQCQDPNDSDFLQLPFMTDAIIKKLRLEKESFKKYIGLTPEERNLTSAFTESEAKIIESTISMLPRISIKVSCGVEGSKGIYQGDILTLKVKGTIKRSVNNDDCESQQDAPFSAHSNLYPQAKQEIIWIIITSDKVESQYNCIRINRRATEFQKQISCFIYKVFHSSKYRREIWDLLFQLCLIATKDLMK